MMKVVENMISYALVRAEYRAYVKNKWCGIIKLKYMQVMSNELASRNYDILVEAEKQSLM